MYAECAAPRPAGARRAAPSAAKPVDTELCHLYPCPCPSQFVELFRAGVWV